MNKQSSEYLKYMKSRVSTLSVYIICFIFDAVFIGFWVLIQYLIGFLIEKFNLSHLVDQWMLLALRVIFALFTLVPVIVYFYVDMRVIFIRAQRRIIAEKNQSNVPSNLCFSLSLKFQEYLDLSAEFRQMLEKNGIMLSNTVSFITVKIGSQWRIIDNDKIYFFKREKDRINVYVDGDDHE